MHGGKTGITVYNVSMITLYVELFIFFFACMLIAGGGLTAATCMVK